MPHEGVMNAKSGYLIDNDIGNELNLPMRYGDLFLLGSSDDNGDVVIAFLIGKG